MIAILHEEVIYGQVERDFQPPGGGPITATIALRGLPVKEMVDAASHIVIISRLEKNGRVHRADCSPWVE
jgi:hypothetical protein